MTAPAEASPPAGLAPHAAIDPFAPAPGGCYTDELVRVRSSATPGGLAVSRRADGRLDVAHGMRPTDLDDDLAERLAIALAPHTDDHDVFARTFVGIVVSSDPDPLLAWEAFYRNSLGRLADPSRHGYVDIYRRAIELLPDQSVLDLGCSFGFLALHLAARGTTRVVAADTDPGTVGLLSAMSARLGHPLAVVQTGPGTGPIAADAVDAVALLHVLEHVDADTGEALLHEALRIARHQVVVAVPYEETASALYGHVRTLTAADLHELGARSGRPFSTHEHHGGWLVLAAH